MQEVDSSDLPLTVIRILSPRVIFFPAYCEDGFLFKCALRATVLYEATKRTIPYIQRGTDIVNRSCRFDVTVKINGLTAVIFTHF